MSNDNPFFKNSKKAVLNQVFSREESNNQNNQNNQNTMNNRNQTQRFDGNRNNQSRQGSTNMFGRNQPTNNSQGPSNNSFLMRPSQNPFQATQNPSNNTFKQKNKKKQLRIEQDNSIVSEIFQRPNNRYPERPQQNVPNIFLNNQNNQNNPNIENNRNNKNNQNNQNKFNNFNNLNNSNNSNNSNRPNLFQARQQIPTNKPIGNTNIFAAQPLRQSSQPIISIQPQIRLAPVSQPVIAQPPITSLNQNIILKVAVKYLNSNSYESLNSIYLNENLKARDDYQINQTKNILNKNVKDAIKTISDNHKVQHLQHSIDVQLSNKIILEHVKQTFNKNVQNRLLLGFDFYHQKYSHQQVNAFYQVKILKNPCQKLMKEIVNLSIVSNPLAAYYIVYCVLQRHNLLNKTQSQIRRLNNPNIMQLIKQFIAKDKLDMLQIYQYYFISTQKIIKKDEKIYLFLSFFRLNSYPFEIYKDNMQILYKTLQKIIQLICINCEKTNEQNQNIEEQIFHRSMQFLTLFKQKIDLSNDFIKKLKNRIHQVHICLKLNKNSATLNNAINQNDSGSWSILTKYLISDQNYQSNQDFNKLYQYFSEIDKIEEIKFNLNQWIVLIQQHVNKMKQKFSQTLIFSNLLLFKIQFLQLIITIQILQKINIKPNSLRIINNQISSVSVDNQTNNISNKLQNIFQDLINCVVKRRIDLSYIVLINYIYFYAKKQHITKNPISNVNKTILVCTYNKNLIIEVLMKLSIKSTMSKIIDNYKESIFSLQQKRLKMIINQRYLQPLQKYQNLPKDSLKNINSIQLLPCMVLQTLHIQFPKCLLNLESNFISFNKIKQYFDKLSSHLSLADYFNRVTAQKRLRLSQQTQQSIEKQHLMYFQNAKSICTNFNTKFVTYFVDIMMQNYQINNRNDYLQYSTTLQYCLEHAANISQLHYQAFSSYNFKKHKQISYYQQKIKNQAQIIKLEQQLIWSIIQGYHNAVISFFKQINYNRYDDSAIKLSKFLNKYLMLLTSICDYDNSLKKNPYLKILLKMKIINFTLFYSVRQNNINGQSSFSSMISNILKYYKGSTQDPINIDIIKLINFLEQFFIQILQNRSINKSHLKNQVDQIFFNLFRMFEEMISTLSTTLKFIIHGFINDQIKLSSQVSQLLVKFINRSIYLQRILNLYGVQSRSINDCVNLIVVSIKQKDFILSSIKVLQSSLLNKILQKKSKIYLIKRLKQLTQNTSINSEKLNNSQQIQRIKSFKKSFQLTTSLYINQIFSKDTFSTLNIIQQTIFVQEFRTKFNGVLLNLQNGKVIAMINSLFHIIQRRKILENLTQTLQIINKRYTDILTNKDEKNIIANVSNPCEINFQLKLIQQILKLSYFLNKVYQKHLKFLQNVTTSKQIHKLLLYMVQKTFNLMSQIHLTLKIFNKQNLINTRIINLFILNIKWQPFIRSLLKDEVKQMFFKSFCNNNAALLFHKNAKNIDYYQSKAQYFISFSKTVLLLTESMNNKIKLQSLNQNLMKNTKKPLAIYLLKDISHVLNFSRLAIQLIKLQRVIDDAGLSQLQEQIIEKNICCFIKELIQIIQLIHGQIIDSFINTSQDIEIYINLLDNIDNFKRSVQHLIEHQKCSNSNNFIKTLQKYKIYLNYSLSQNPLKKQNPMKKQNPTIKQSRLMAQNPVLNQNTFIIQNPPYEQYKKTPQQKKKKQKLIYYSSKQQIPICKNQQQFKKQFINLFNVFIQMPCINLINSSQYHQSNKNKVQIQQKIKYQLINYKQIIRFLQHFDKFLQIYKQIKSFQIFQSFFIDVNNSNHKYTQQSISYILINILENIRFIQKIQISNPRLFTVVDNINSNENKSLYNKLSNKIHIQTTQIPIKEKSLTETQQYLGEICKLACLKLNVLVMKIFNGIFSKVNLSNLQKESQKCTNYSCRYKGKYLIQLFHTLMICYLTSSTHYQVFKIKQMTKKNSNPIQSYPCLIRPLQKHLYINRLCQFINICFNKCLIDYKILSSPLSQLQYSMRMWFNPYLPVDMMIEQASLIQILHNFYQSSIYLLQCTSKSFNKHVSYQQDIISNFQFQLLNIRNQYHEKSLIQSTQFNKNNILQGNDIKIDYYSAKINYLNLLEQINKVQIYNNLYDSFNYLREDNTKLSQIFPKCVKQQNFVQKSVILTYFISKNIFRGNLNNGRLTQQEIKQNKQKQKLRIKRFKQLKNVKINQSDLLQQSCKDLPIQLYSYVFAQQPSDLRLASTCSSIINKINSIQRFSYSIQIPKIKNWLNEIYKSLWYQQGKMNNLILPR